MSGPRLLVVRFSAIGDCVMAVPTASAFRRTHPDGFIAWSIEDRCAAVADVETLVDLRLEAARQTWKRHRWSPATWRAQVGYYARLRRERFDYGVDLQGHSKTALCLRIAKPLQRASVPGTDPLARRLNPTVAPREGAVHVVERNLAVLRSLGEFPGDSSPIMPRLGAERARIDVATAAGKPLATITASAGSTPKVVPLDHWLVVAEHVSRRGYQVAFLGGPGDPEPEFAGMLNWVGRLPLEETMAAVAESAVHLCGDTGTGHIAAAYGVPVVSVFGNMDPARYRPYTDKAIVLKEGATASHVPPEKIVEAFGEIEERYGRKVPD